MITYFQITATKIRLKFDISKYRVIKNEDSQHFFNTCYPRLAISYRFGWLNTTVQHSNNRFACHTSGHPSMWLHCIGR